MRILSIGSVRNVIGIRENGLKTSQGGTGSQQKCCATRAAFKRLFSWMYTRVLRSFTRSRIRSLKTEERERKKNKAQTRVGFVRIKIAYRFKSPVRDARRRPTIIEGLWRVQQECCAERRSCKNTKQKRMPFLFKKAALRRPTIIEGLWRVKQENKSYVPLVGDMRNTRFLEFLAGVLSKGVWWMPRLKKAMKDAA